MKFNFRNLIACVGLIVLSVCSVQAQTATVKMTYPDSYHGPYYMEATGKILQPTGGSKWAFGLTNICGVPHLSSFYFYAKSLSPSINPSYYQGRCAFQTYLPTGFYISIGNSYFGNWHPASPGGSTSRYLPSNAVPQYVTVPAGQSRANASWYMQDTIGYQMIGTYVDSFFTCCENGQGCY